MNENRKWYAVYTRPKCEKKVAERLSRTNIENYCPTNRVVSQWSDRKKIIHEPLFTSYVFVRIGENELLPLKQTDGVVNLVYWLGKPAVIHDEEIETIKMFLNEHATVKLEKTQVCVNDQVRILGGPLMQQQGQVLFVKGKTVKITLPSLGYLMYAEFETSNVEIVVPAIPAQTPAIPAQTEELSYPLYAIK
ncbi:MAG TPA: UpxY family transcription antiterminator [Chitinophagaceae bacterium]|nr:UpxY family transcription antiterminator [Chitinophagaceae bacterium]